MKEINTVKALREDELYVMAKDLQVPYELVKYVHDHGRLPVPNFSAGGVATPADAALMRRLGADGVFVGSPRPPAPRGHPSPQGLRQLDQAGVRQVHRSGRAGVLRQGAA